MCCEKDKKQGMVLGIGEGKADAPGSLASCSEGGQHLPLCCFLSACSLGLEFGQGHCSVLTGTPGGSRCSDHKLFLD